MTFTLAEAVEAELEIKKSRFIAHVAPVASRQAAMALLSRLRDRYPDAGHHCWAMLAGNEAAANDDGEPSGTAGRPMLNVLQHKALQDVCAVVVRYFGGVKLGAGGLTRAYGQAVSLALQQASLMPVVAMARLSLLVEPALEHRVRHWCAQAGVAVGAESCDQLRRLDLDLPQARCAAARAELDNLTQGRARWLDELGTGVA